MAEDKHIPADMDPQDARVILEALDEDVSAGQIEDYDEALAAFLTSGLMAGPDPSIIDDVKALPDAATQLANDAALDARVEEIYQQIIQRAPEHKVQPSLDRVQLALDLLGNPPQYLSQYSYHGHEW